MECAPVVAAKRAPATKAPAKAPAKKTPAKKAPAKKATQKKAAPAKSTAPRKTAAKKTAARKAPAKKAPARKAPARKAPARKAPARKAPARKGPAKKAAATKAPATKSAPKAGANRGAAPTSSAAKKGAAGWTAKELRAVGKALEAELAELRREYEQTMLTLNDMQQTVSDGSGDDQADAGSKTFEREHEMSLANNRLDLITQMEHALVRIADGSYGRCESCGETIAKARLQAFPAATLCLTCKQREERR
jgi:RNA polymerase-binding protein DksA